MSETLEPGQINHLGPTVRSAPLMDLVDGRTDARLHALAMQEVRCKEHRAKKGRPCFPIAHWKEKGIVCPDRLAKYAGSRPRWRPFTDEFHIGLGLGLFIAAWDLDGSVWLILSSALVTIAWGGLSFSRRGKRGLPSAKARERIEPCSRSSSTRDS